MPSGITSVLPILQLPRPGVRMKRNVEDIRAMVVARHVKGHRLPVDRCQVQFGDDDRFLVKGRWHNILSIGTNDRAATVLQERIGSFRQFR